MTGMTGFAGDTPTQPFATDNVKTNLDNIPIIGYMSFASCAKGVPDGSERG
ncbi:MAG: hypothetical protein KGL46_14090 [Hyphomicrobiales bacterium]|nr:hypothetical protein [Hyphomicrobiales bacterium]